MLVNRGGDRWQAPEVRFDRPAWPSIRVKRKRYLHPATARAGHASPLLDAGVDDQPQLARRYGVLARMPVPAAHDTAGGSGCWGHGILPLRRITRGCAYAVAALQKVDGV